MSSIHNLTTGAILTGGHSQRMGRDKAALLLRGKTLLEWAVATLHPLVRQVILVGGNQQHARTQIVPDIYADKGPLGGIYSALSASSLPYVLVVPVDTPLLRGETLERMLRKWLDADIAVIRTADGRVHPLCGVYHQNCLAAVLQSVEAGRLKVDGLFQNPELNVRYIEASDLGCSDWELTNVNTPDDYLRAQEILAARG